MLPKVATHLFHHTSRAAAAVQNQTSQAIRNVLQYQQVTPSASAGGGGGITGWGGVGSSSGWGSGSAGPGGAKYHAGSRFYSGYTGPGRSVTQANQSSAQPDDNDERTIHPVRVKLAPAPASSRTRPRSNSLSLSAQDRIDRGEGLGVLKVVQMRARHAFAAHRSVIAAEEPIELSERPVLVRRNSTSTHSVVSEELDVDSALPPLPPSVLAVEHDLTDPAAPQSVTEPIIDAEAEAADVNAADLEAYERIRKARGTHNYNKVLEEVERYRSQPRVSVPCYNMAMRGLFETRAVGQPITLILELYNEMLARDLLPNLRTYTILISALCTRDAEVQRVILSLENRISRRTYAGRGDAGANATDQQRIAQLRAENNFGSALTLFQAATTIRNRSLGLPVYNTLLRSCAWHSNVDAAIRVYAHMESFPEERPSATTFSNLMAVYCSLADLEGAKEVFNEFKEASRKGRIAWHIFNPSELAKSNSPSGRPFMSRTAQIQVWNKMIDTYIKCGEPAAALELLEAMLDTAKGQAFDEADVPLPNSVTYTSIIAGFCDAGDWQSALSWFDRLLAQPRAAASPHEPLSAPPRPDQLAWIAMIDTLARHGAVDELNRIFAKLQELATEDKLHIRTIDRYSVFRANLDAIQAPGVSEARAGVLVDYIIEKVMEFDSPAGSLALTTAAARSMLIELVRLLADRNEIDRALEIAERYVETERTLLRQAEVGNTIDSQQVLYHSKGVRGMVQSLSGILVGWSSASAGSESRVTPIKQTIRAALLGEQVGIMPQSAIVSWYIHSYVESKKRGDPLDLSLPAWELLTRAYIANELSSLDPEVAESSAIDSMPPPHGYEYPGLYTLLVDMAQANVDIGMFEITTRRKIMRTITQTHGREEAIRLMSELGPAYEGLLALRGAGVAGHGSGIQAGDSIPEQTPHPGVHVDLYHSRFVEEWFPVNPNVSPLIAFERFEAGAQKGIYPSPECLGRLIGGLGRLGEVTKVRTLYEAAQRVLAALEEQKRWQSAGWFIVEDQMIIAFAHAGQYEAAHVHRIRIIEQGGTPSADAYGALISSVKDTTDDTSNAMQLWDEAMSRDVRPNIYMYNTIISKLAKARKADHALAIFQRMKTDGVKPSSVTYGALIAACCRVGDAQSAEHLFHEMSSARNFKPRVPPYNTMIQLYTYTKPDRDRVLYYYNALLLAKIKPTAHTYKLLLDAYGTIQPVDTASMEDIFKLITESRDIEIQGTHWAAMINAYGCAGKDLNRAIGIFESIADHASTSRASTNLPDAVVYEALFTVFSAHHRSDLIRAYLQRLRASHVHPTAYVANAAIKGYAAAGDLESARDMFESLEDPPMGVAAPHNRAPHEAQRTLAKVSPQAPVYREPSTWEAMVRAELGVGERDRAMDLIQRMEARQYPEAVVQRVRDIMHTDVFEGESPTPPSSISSVSI